MIKLTLSAIAASLLEIDVLDPAGYGALNITKAIIIQVRGFSGTALGTADPI